ncbi:F420-0--gamma-glutamyl ligase [Anaerosporomusa subterranea]|uniref:F420-0--gamma-glutamyl ligase n=1 Tax=Anaerosporomusa subterranea TaxID=1794912 RepID=A0A154BVT5_ANASB|nr:coenzyme F420-0:L-glutamate ligase [Anaerosporomusa subterranea]KYZ78027.1 F420-0--gamma-glutamyl ligase [Anaerosporomusa subterranea]
MARTIGTTVRGIRTPIVKEGDDIVNIIVNSVLTSAKEENFCIKDGDVIGITESLVARSQGNYASVQDIAQDINAKYKGDIAVLFPILSRNRFSLILKGIALSGKTIHLFLNYPSDEMGNHLIDVDIMDDLGINPYTDTLSEEKYRQLFGEHVAHPFTGIDYIKLYKELATNGNIHIYLTNDPTVALNYTKEILVANIHERHRTKKRLIKAGATTVYGLDDLLDQPIAGSGYNPDFGVLGSNKASEETIKLFPRDCQTLVVDIQKAVKQATGKHTEVMVYGDGAFKDPQGKIWELADPVVSPGYTVGLRGMPNEIKIKYIADNELRNLCDDALTEAIKAKIKTKKDNLSSQDAALGTTPRQLTDLLGSLCDLTSGSGDKGTPVILIQGYFDNYATE